LFQIDLAKLGLFNLPDKTPFESVLFADLYESFTVVAALKAQAQAQKPKHNDNNTNKQLS
jgi:hypothetical protein